MEAAEIPTKTPIAWAEDASSSDVAVIPDTTGAPGRASWAIGFPPLNMKPIDAGGIPPYGQDQNGALKAMSEWIRWVQMGGPISYDAGFAAAIGGYPAGAIVRGSSVNAWWFSVTDNNTTDPDDGTGDWVAWGAVVSPFYNADGTSDAWVVVTDPLTPFYSDGLALGIIVQATNGGPVTLDAGDGPAQIRRSDGAQLAAGDLVANMNVMVIYDGAISRWRLVAPVASQLAGVGLKSDGAAKLTPDIAGLTAGSVVIGSMVMFWNGTALRRTTAGSIAGLAVLSDEFISEMQFWGSM